MDSAPLPTGLSSSEAAARLKQYGSNQLKPARQRAITPAAHYLGFTPLPAKLFPLLLGLILDYLALVEGGEAVVLQTSRR